MSDQMLYEPRLLKHFSTCSDPRTRPVQYPLIEIIVIVVLGTLCGEEGWEAYVDWAKDKEEFLKKFLKMKHGIPSADTLRRVIERINSKELMDSFSKWSQELVERSTGQICIDGKALRGVKKKGEALHLVTAWCETNRMVLSSIKTDRKSNEITAINELLNTLVLQKGDIVTIDAIGCQKKIIEKIHGQRADYVIALKKNQRNLWAEVENFFDQSSSGDMESPVSGICSCRKGTGGLNQYHTWISNDVSWLPQRDDWKGISSVVMVVREWTDGTETKYDRRYYITSMDATAEQMESIVRRHWSIENELHWHLDVTFNEDASQIGAEANENLRVARMIGLELLRSEKTFKRGLKAKARRCARNEAYLTEVLLVGNV